MAFQIKAKKKNRPRGRPFPKGHKIGHRFPKGTSGNPGGRPKMKLMSEAYKAALELEEHAKFPVPRTNAEAIAQKMVSEAKAGKVNAAGEITDRVEGKPRQAYDVKMSIMDELPDLIAEGRKRVAERRVKK
jgi:hypothetical protein